jgi:hypothetical protein
MPWAMMGLGLLLVGVFVSFLIRKISGGVKGALGARRGGRRGRRR